MELMNKTLLTLQILFLIISISCKKEKNEMTQDHFLLTVNAKNFPDSTKVILYDKDLDKNIDSSYVIGERFTF